jgi:hypothetical protein
VLRAYREIIRHCGALPRDRSKRFIEPACRELRNELKLPSPDVAPLTEHDVEMFWGLHGRIFYLAIRRFIYATPTPAKLDDAVRDAVISFLDGTKSTVPFTRQRAEPGVIALEREKLSGSHLYKLDRLSSAQTDIQILN